jgi:hypothetical protein
VEIRDSKSKFLQTIEMIDLVSEALLLASFGCFGFLTSSETTVRRKLRSRTRLTRGCHKDRKDTQYYKINPCCTKTAPPLHCQVCYQIMDIALTYCDKSTFWTMFWRHSRYVFSNHRPKPWTQRKTFKQTSKTLNQSLNQPYINPKRTKPETISK